MASILLYAVGEQDAYIKGKPSMTYFRSVYTRYTPFITETLEVPFYTEVLPGGTSTCIIPPKGDVIRNITLRSVLSALYTTNAGAFVWPVWPGDIVNQPTGYILVQGIFVIAFESIPTTVYYSTFNLFVWLQQYYPATITVSYDSVSGSFVYTGTTTIYFANTESAIFYGFDARRPDVRLQTYYGYTITTTRTAQLSAVQSGWIQGIVPPVDQNYLDGVGTRLVRNTKLYIGGQVINDITGSYIDLMNDVNVPYENQAGLTVLVGKNDSSPQLTSRYCFTDLDFGVPQLPICGLSKQDVRVSVDFNTAENLVQSQDTGGGSIFEASSYIQSDQRNRVQVNNFDIVLAGIYNDTLVFDNASTNQRYFFDTSKNVDDPTAYTSGTKTSATVFTPNGKGSGQNGVIIESNIYRYDTTQRYVTVLPVSDYFVTNTNTTQTATRSIWQGDAFGPSMTYAGTTGAGGPSTQIIGALGACGKYMFYMLSLNYVNVVSSNLHASWVSNTVPVGTSWSTVFRFYNKTSLTVGERTAWHTYIVAKLPTSTGHSTSTVTSGNDCLATTTFTYSGTSYFLNEIWWNMGVVRYDTLKGINDPSAYSFFQDWYNVLGIDKTQYGVMAGDPNVQFSLNMQTDGRYMYQRVDVFLVVIDSLNFMTSGGYKKYNYTSISPVPNLSGPFVSDGTYGYLGMPGYTSSAYNFSRFRIGSDLSLSASWTVFNSSSSLPWQTILQFAPAFGLNPNMEVYCFDGRYIYYSGASQYASPIVIIYDTSLPFQASSFSWISKHWSAKLYLTTPLVTVYKSFSDYRNLVTIDSAGNFYIVGHVTDVSHIVRNFDGSTFTTISSITAGNGMQYIVKYNSSGVGQWIVKINGQRSGTTFTSGNNEASGIRKLKVDSAGNMYVCGGGLEANSGLYYNANGTQYTNTFLQTGGFGNGFVFKTNSAGAIQWFIYTATPSAAGCTGIYDLDIDGSGNVYFCGSINAPGGQGNFGPRTMSIYSTGSAVAFKSFTTAGSLADGFIAKSNSNGLLQWASNLSSTNTNTFGTSIRYDTTYGVVLSGTNESTLSVWNADGTFNGTLAFSGPADGFVILYNSTTGVVSSKVKVTTGSYLGVHTIAHDSTNGFVYLGTTDGFNVRLYKIALSTLTTVWTSVISGSDYEGGVTVTLDPSGNPYLTCFYRSSVLTVYDSTGAVFATHTNTASPYFGRVYTDVLMVKYSTAGIPQWSKTVQGAADDFPLGMYVDGTNVWLYMSYLSNQLSISPDSLLTSTDQIGEAYGGSQQLLIKYSASTGDYDNLYYKNAAGLNDRFVTSTGTDITGLNPAVQVGLWPIVQGPRYLYLYSSEPYNSSLSAPNLWQFDPYTFQFGFSASILVEYATLSQKEYDWLRSTTQDIVITQTQRMSVPITLTQTFIPLRFESAIQEFFVTLMESANQLTYTYSNLTSMALTFNGEQVIDYDSILYQFVEPWETKTTFPTRNVFMHNFNAPVNFSRIREKMLRINTPTGTYTADIYAKALNVLRIRGGISGLMFNSWSGLE